VRLDTPEEIAVWIAERKRRWPTDARTAEKKRKLEEALANGELHPDHLALMGNKRFKSFSSDPEVAVTRTRRGRGGRPFGFGGRGRGRGAYSWNRVHERSAVPDGIASSFAQTLPSSRPPAVKDTKIPRPPSVSSAPPSARDADADADVALHLGSDDNGDDDDDDDDAAPEEVSAKRPHGMVAYGSSSDAELEKPHAANVHSQPGPTASSSSCTRPANAAATQPSILAKAESANRFRRGPPPQPKMPPRNPFAARPSLLRNVSEQHSYTTCPSLYFVLTVARACL
jgi:fragile X mental retardation-interacting protein 1 (NUFIP1)